MFNELQQLADEAPARPVLEGIDEAVSAADLLARVKELALHLRTSQAHTVGLLADNSINWVVVDLACQYEEICLVPIPTFFSDSQVRHVIETAGVDRLIFDGACSPRVPSAYSAPSKVIPGAAGMHSMSVPRTHCPAMPLKTAKITFTSGSTGTPKGVCLSTSQCLSVASSLADAVNIDAPRHLCVLPLSTLLENIAGIYMPMLSGGNSLVYPSEALGMAGSSGIKAQQFLEAIDRLKPQTMILVPQLLALLDAAMTSGWQPPASLQFIAVGGGRVAPAMLGRAREAGLPVYEGYGLSECASVVSLNTPCGDRPGTSGKVLPHVEVSEHDGELVVSGNTFLGYLNQPQTWGVQAVATGDLGQIDEDSYVTVHGRSKNVLVSSFGRNISPEWVESELVAVAEIQQAVLIGDDRPWCTALLWPSSDDLAADRVQENVDAINSDLPDYARVKKWHLMSEPMTAANGLMTENGRPRRDQIVNRYSELIEDLYRSAEIPIAR
ncbi:MAG: AMP-binding protein [Halieaceae bacterium]|nr:AMP-binding protein [Halieaceae bacterium]